jgi:hypothetical protein
MKKLNLLLVALVLAAQLMAQETKPAPSSPSTSSMIAGRLGFYGGINFANINGDSQSYSTLTGWQAGIMYCIFSSGGLFSCWLEPGYNAIGAKYGDSYGGGNYSGSVALGYIMVPVIARFQSEKGLFGDIGVQPQFLVSAKDKYSGGSHDYKNYVNGFDMGIPVGVGYEYKKKFGISARYCFGITNINKMSSDGKDHNSVFSIRLHYRLAGK